MTEDRPTATHPPQPTRNSRIGPGEILPKTTPAEKNPLPIGDQHICPSATAVPEPRRTRCDSVLSHLPADHAAGQASGWLEPLFPHGDCPTGTQAWRTGTWLWSRWFEPSG